MTTLDEDLTALRALGRDALILRYRAEVGREPRQKGRPWLVRRLAWRAQERRLGGLSTTAREKLDQLVAEIDLPTAAPKAKGHVARPCTRADGPTNGTTIAREYKGERLLLRVEEGGFRVEGCARVDASVRHRSMSAAAAAVCGQHVSGRLWWQLVSRNGRRA